jgi:hypothetical protein
MEVGVTMFRITRQIGLKISAIFFGNIGQGLPALLIGKDNIG